MSDEDIELANLIATLPEKSKKPGLLWRLHPHIICPWCSYETEIGEHDPAHVVMCCDGCDATLQLPDSITNGSWSGITVEQSNNRKISRGRRSKDGFLRKNTAPKIRPCVLDTNEEK